MSPSLVSEMFPFCFDWASSTAEDYRPPLYATATVMASQAAQTSVIDEITSY